MRVTMTKLTLRRRHPSLMLAFFTTLLPAIDLTATKARNSSGVFGRVSMLSWSKRSLTSGASRAPG